MKREKEREKLREKELKRRRNEYIERWKGTDKVDAKEHKCLCYVSLDNVRYRPCFELCFPLNVHHGANNVRRILFNSHL